MRFHELDAFVDGVLTGGPLEQKLQANDRSGPVSRMAGIERAHWNLKTALVVHTDS